MFRFALRFIGVIVTVLVFSACAAKAPSMVALSEGWTGKSLQVEDCMPGLIQAKLYIAWDEVKGELFAELENGSRTGEPTALYGAQVMTNNLLEAAAACRELGLLSDLASYIVIPFNYLKVRDGINTWANEQGEVVNTLSRSQFLFLVSRALNVIASLPKGARTEAMDELLTKAPKVAYEHYKSWIMGRPSFQVTGWRCHGHDEDAEKRAGEYFFNHYDFLRYKRAGELTASKAEAPYCNALTDNDMWIFAGLLELMAARENLPALFKLSQRDLKKLKEYFIVAEGAIRDAFVETRLVNFQGEEVKGAVVEPGAWDEHPERAYSGYVGVAYPSKEDKGVAPNTSWDISHARRLVHILDSLYRNIDMIGASFPTEENIRYVANQYAYRVFNRNFNRPLFTNYFDGTNGWYRVGYAGRKNFGYRPYKLSNTAVTGGYGFWKKYNPDIAKINEALWRMIQSNDPRALEFVKKYYHGTGRVRNLALIQFLPVFVKSRD